MKENWKEKKREKKGVVRVIQEKRERDGRRVALTTLDSRAKIFSLFN
jgi:hypothetical protein